MVLCLLLRADIGDSMVWQLPNLLLIPETLWSPLPLCGVDCGNSSRAFSGNGRRWNGMQFAKGIPKSESSLAPVHASKKKEGNMELSEGFSWHIGKDLVWKTLVPDHFPSVSHLHGNSPCAIKLSAHFEERSEAGSRFVSMAAKHSWVSYY